MKKLNILLFQGIAILMTFFLFQCNPVNEQTSTEEISDESFPSDLVDFKPYEGNPVFTGTGKDTWDKKIRERGYILYDEGQYKMWYTGFNYDQSNQMMIGYATSPDGIHWKRYSDQPIYSERWTEDMHVSKIVGTYYMYAEGTNDVAHMLTSTDGIHWDDQGDLIIQKTTGEQIPGPYGTPTLWVENGEWYLFYERNDSAIWLAESTDKIHWANVQDDPVLKRGPDRYDRSAVAVNQIVKQDDYYYMYYHATDNQEWITDNSKSIWTSSLARSKDLIHWEKYPDNPFIPGDFSSPIIVFNDTSHFLYTMHPVVNLFLPVAE